MPIASRRWRLCSIVSVDRSTNKVLVTPPSLKREQATHHCRACVAQSSLLPKPGPAPFQPAIPAAPMLATLVSR